MSFSIKETFKYSFQLFRKHFWKVLILSAISLTFIAALQIFIAYFVIVRIVKYDLNPGNVAGFITILSNNRAALFVLQYVAFFLLKILGLFFLTSAFLPLFNGSELRLKNYFPNFRKILQFIAGMILLLILPISIAILSSFLCYAAVSSVLAAPDTTISASTFLIQILLFVARVTILLWLFRYFFFYIEIFENNSILQSFKNSAVIMKEQIYKFFLLLFLLILINCIGMLSIVGTVITLPFSVLALIHVYIQLSGKKRNKQIKNKITEVL